MQNVLSKIKRNLGVVRKVSYFLDRESLLQLFHSLILSHIRYGIIIWHYGQISLRKKLQACANKFLRQIFFLGPRESVRNIMKEHSILSVNQIFHLKISRLCSILPRKHWYQFFRTKQELSMPKLAALTSSIYQITLRLNVGNP